MRLVQDLTDKILKQVQDDEKSEHGSGAGLLKLTFV